MKLIWHGFRKDLRHCRFMLFVWLALAAGQGAMMGVNTATANMPKTMMFAMVSFLIPLLQYLTLLVIVPLLVQADAPLGTTAFWYTRPVSRAQVLIGKLLFIVLVLVLPPLIAELLVLRFNGALANHLTLAGAEIVIKQLRFIMVVAALAAVTRRFAHFALVSACILVAYFPLLWLTGWFVRLLYPSLKSAFSADDWIALMPARSVVKYLILIVFGSAVFVHQYLRRHLRASLAIAAVAVVLHLSCSLVWQWNFLKPPNVARSATVKFAEENVKVTPVANSLTRIDLPAFVGSGMKVFGCEFEIGGIPPGAFVQMKSVSRLRLDYPGSGTVKGIAPAGNMAFSAQMKGPKTNVPPAYVRELLGVEPMAQESHEVATWTPLMLVPGEKFEQHHSESGVFTATANLVASSYAVGGEMQLAAGSHYATAGQDVTILEVLEKDASISVIIRERKLNLMLDRNELSVPWPFNMIQAQAANADDYVLVNKRNWEMLLPDTDGMADVASLVSSMLPRRLKILTKTLTFSRADINPDVSPLDKAWLADAVLLRIENKRLCTFHRDLRLEDLVLADAELQ